MGLADIFGLGWSSEPTYDRQFADVTEKINAAVAERLATFQMSDALQMPSVRRGIDLICTVGATLQPQTYRGGERIPNPPIVRRPDPLRSRYDWQLIVLRSLVEAGNAYVRKRDGVAIVQDPYAVTVEDDASLLPRWRVDGVLMTDVEQIRIGQRPGYHVGISPLQSALDTLAIISAAEDYASTYFSSNGTPHTVLTTEQKLTPAETKALRDAYVKARGESGVAALSQGFEAMFPSNDPESSQLTDTRELGNRIVSRLLGIPGPLMLVEGVGGSLTYTNANQLINQLAKHVILPMYLSPVEAWLSDQLPRGTTVRYSVGELVRADVKDRVSVYQQLQTMGVVSAEQIAVALNLDPDEVPESSPTAEVPTDA